MNRQMKAIRLNEYGTPDVLNITDADVPSPKPGEVLLKVQAIGVNYSDILRRRNTYFQPTPLPFTPGHEAVGIIEAVGEGVTEPFVTGLRILAILPASGGYAEYVTGPAQYCVPLPPNLDAKQATALFVQGSTAQLMVSAIAGDIAGKTVLVNAASGGVGSLLVQLTKMAGATVFAASSSEEKLQLAQKMGADNIINYSDAYWSEKVKEMNKGKGVDVVFEMVGGDVYNESIKCLVPGGHLIIYGAASGVQGNVRPEHFVDENLTQTGFNLAFYIQNKTAAWQAALGAVIGMVAEGALKIEVSNSFPLQEAAEAHRQIEARKTTGKVTLVPDEFWQA